MQSRTNHCPVIFKENKEKNEKIKNVICLYEKQEVLWIFLLIIVIIWTIMIVVNVIIIIAVVIIIVNVKEVYPSFLVQL